MFGRRLHNFGEGVAQCKKIGGVDGAEEVSSVISFGLPREHYGVEGAGEGVILVIFMDTPTGNNLNPYIIMCIPSPRSKEPPSLTVVQGAAGQNRAAEMEKPVFLCL